MSRTISSVLFLLVMAAIAAVGIVYLRSYSGTEVKPAVSTSAAADIVMYRQDDEKWASEKLGGSEYTMKSSGCLVSCIASALTMQGAEQTPGTLNRIFSENNVYDSEGNILWDKIDAFDFHFARVYDDVSSEDIDKCLSDGDYPIVKVRRNGNGSFHYVLIAGTENGEYVCMDPLEDELMLLSDYGDTVYSVRCVGIEKISADTESNTLN
ncbi:MAG: hypothetical protein IJX77_05505 [Ruminococcus sp.]|nr:hypothetical protein [Ruminococcus sp.]